MLFAMPFYIEAAYLLQTLWYNLFAEHKTEKPLTGWVGKWII
jgi:hypothetical protein